MKCPISEQLLACQAIAMEATTANASISCRARVGLDLLSFELDYELAFEQKPLFRLLKLSS